MFCYIHIPFCENKCKYCKFASFGISQSDKIKKYIDKLISDIKNDNKKINRLKSVYFGGGTPATLKIPDLKLILNTLKSKYGFNENIEITLETTPNKVTELNLIGWKKIGINRLSIGVQTLNNDSLIEIGRGNKGDVITALENVKNIGFENISLDFIIGLPHLKKGEVKKDLKLVLEKYSFVKHISVYMLEDHYYPGNWKNVSIDENEYLGEYIEVKKYLKEKGFNRYEISNFAKSGYECKHNKAYWNHSDILAFGLGSHGFFDGKRYSISDNFEDFYDNKNILEEKLSIDDVFLEKVIFGLRTNGLEENIYKKLNNKKIQELIDSGYLKIENDILKLCDRGVLVQDFILGEII